jgi:two-component system alkaline phosphatase synthesis response regulator PhoP
MNVLKLGNLVLDQTKQEVIVNGRAYHVTPKECRLLATFLKNPGKILTRAFLMQEVWETNFTEDTRTLEVHISWLRSKIEEDSSNPKLIQTVRGTGYMFERK